MPGPEHLSTPRRGSHPGQRASPLLGVDRRPPLPCTAPMPAQHESENQAPEVVAGPDAIELAPADTRAGEARNAILVCSQQAIDQINGLLSTVFVTRGGRVGSGLGLLLEGLWGFYINQALYEHGFEVAWRASHDYNDYACIDLGETWDPEDRSTELLRVEAKSMNLGADESKGHFDELADVIGSEDLLLVLLWEWVEADRTETVCPAVIDYFVGSARRIAYLRDQLHLRRGGWFVDRNACPDNCDPQSCLHHGEPINSSGVRERKSGPDSSVAGKTQFQANFGGLVRMLKTRSNEARQTFRQIRRDDDVAHEYISFIHRNLPAEELNSYLTSEWRAAVQELLGLDGSRRSAQECQHLLRTKTEGYAYMEWLRHNVG